MKKTIECYEIEVKFLVRKDYWAMDGAEMTAKVIKDRVQEGGIEVPIEDVQVKIKK